MLPQAYAPATYYQFNPRGLEGFIPDKTFSLGVYLRQMIYDDRVVTDYKSAGKDHEASQEALEAERMNVLASAGAAFLDLTLSRILFGIEVQDLALAEENLQLARVRLETGYSGPDEVLRWEAEVARRRSTLLDREAEVDTRGIALNQVLGIEQDRLWNPQDIPVDTETFSFVDGRPAPDDLAEVEGGSPRHLAGHVASGGGEGAELRVRVPTDQAERGDPTVGEGADQAPAGVLREVRQLSEEDGLGAFRRGGGDRGILSHPHHPDPEVPGCAPEGGG